MPDLLLLDFLCFFFLKEWLFFEECELSDSESESESELNDESVQAVSYSESELSSFSASLCNCEATLLF